MVSVTCFIDEIDSTIGCAALFSFYYTVSVSLSVLQSGAFCDSMHPVNSHVTNPMAKLHCLLPQRLLVSNH